MNSHVGDWNRFIIEAPNFKDAAKWAAEINLWLHCWTWKQSNTYNVIDTWEVNMNDSIDDYFQQKFQDL